jgi:hypothetical protein
VSCDHLGENCRIFDGVREGTDLVETARERHEAVTADEAVGGLHADETAQRGWLTNTATRVATQAARCEARGDRGRTATTAAARHT